MSQRDDPLDAELEELLELGPLSSGVLAADHDDGAVVPAAGLGLDRVEDVGGDRVVQVEDEDPDGARAVRPQRASGGVASVAELLGDLEDGSAVAGATRGASWSASDTRVLETPARAATSRMVGCGDVPLRRVGPPEVTAGIRRPDAERHSHLVDRAGLSHRVQVTDLGTPTCQNRLPSVQSDSRTPTTMTLVRSWVRACARAVSSSPMEDTPTA